MSKETYYSVKRDLLQCQKRPTSVLRTLQGSFASSSSSFRCSNQYAQKSATVCTPHKKKRILKKNMETILHRCRPPSVHRTGVCHHGHGSGWRKETQNTHKNKNKKGLQFLSVHRYCVTMEWQPVANRTSKHIKKIKIKNKNVIS